MRIDSVSSSLRFPTAALTAATSPTRKTDDAAATPLPAPAEAQAPPQSHMDLAINALLKHWGTADAAHDLNTDGTVDGLDMGILLQSLSESGTPTTPTAPTTPDAPLSPIDALLAHWGDPTATRFDLNEDGDVNGLDIGVMLAMMAASEADSNAAPAAAAPTAPPTDADTTIADLATSITSRVFATFDHDNDGRIALSDLPAPPGLLKHLTAGSDGSITPRQLVAAISASLQEALTADPSADAQSLADQWISAMMNKSSATPSGRTHAAESARLDNLAGLIAARVQARDESAGPVAPGALRRSINAMNMPPGHKQHLLSRLMSMLPRGRQVDAKA